MDYLKTYQEVNETYKEGENSYVTHKKKEYDLDLLLKAARKVKSKTLPIQDLKWILKWTKVQPKRVKKADLKYPLIVTKEGDSYVVLDGVHRLTKAIRQGLETIKVKIISSSALKRCERKSINENTSQDVWTRQIFGLETILLVDTSFMPKLRHPHKEMLDDFVRVLDNNGYNPVVLSGKIDYTDDWGNSKYVSIQGQPDYAEIGKCFNPLVGSTEGRDFSVYKVTEAGDGGSFIPGYLILKWRDGKFFLAASNETAQVDLEGQL